MNWKFDFSPETSDIFAVWWRCRGLSEGRWWYPLGLDVAKFERRRFSFCSALAFVCKRIFPSPQSQQHHLMNFKTFMECHLQYITIYHMWHSHTFVLETKRDSRIMVCILPVSHYHITHILLSLNRLSKTPFLKLTVLQPLLICLRRQLS